MKKKSSKPIWAAVIVIILAAGIAVLHVMNIDTSIDTQPLPTVSAAHAERGDITVATSLIGTIEPGDVYYCMPKASGEVLAIYVSAGDYVHAGDPICDIDNSKAIDAARISVDAATVSLETARESAALAETNLERMKVLYEAGDISTASYESYVSGRDQAVAAVEAYELQLESAKLSYDTQVEFSTVTSPADGTVETTNMTLSVLVSTGSYVAVVTSDSARKLTFSITDRLLGLVHAGDSVTVEKEGAEYDGRITSIENMISATSGLYPVEAEFEGSELLPIGSRVQVTFDADRSYDTLIVDTDWIYHDGGKTFVYTISYDEDDAHASAAAVFADNRPGTIHKIEVETGLTDGERTEILSGVSETDLIAGTWTSQLYEGAKVQVRPENETP